MTRVGLEPTTRRLRVYSSTRGEDVKCLSACKCLYQRVSECGNFGTQFGHRAFLQTILHGALGGLTPQQFVERFESNKLTLCLDHFYGMRSIHSPCRQAFPGSGCSIPAGRSGFQVHLPQQGLVARMGAQRIVIGMNMGVKHQRLTLVDRLLELVEGFVHLSET
jgi:hypothetical protein